MINESDLEECSIDDITAYGQMYIKRDGKFLKGNKTYTGDFQDRDTSLIVSMPIGARVFRERKKK